MSQVTAPILLDSTGQTISAKLQAIADAINGGTIDPLTVTQNGTYTPSGTTLGYGPVTVNVSGGGGDVPLLTRAQWDALSTAQKQAYGLVAVQDANSGFGRGELYYGADYREFGVVETGSFGNTGGTVTLSNGGLGKLLVIAMNSEARNYQLELAATLNSVSLTGETIETNNYSSAGTNRRNYRISLFDIDCSAGDTLEIVCTNYSKYTRVIWAIVEEGNWTIDKSLTTPDATTRGSNNVSGMVVYGTSDSNASGTITVSIYTAGVTINTDNPGTNYKSSYIYWFV